MKYGAKFFFLSIVFLLFVTVIFSQTVADKSSPCGDLPSLTFKEKNAILTPNTKAILKTVADKLIENPETILVVIAYNVNSKALQILGTVRQTAIKTYVNEALKISEDRIHFNTEGPGAVNTLDLRCELRDNTSPISAQPKHRRK